MPPGARNSMPRKLARLLNATRHRAWTLGKPHSQMAIDAYSNPGRRPQTELIQSEEGSTFSAPKNASPTTAAPPKRQKRRTDEASSSTHNVGIPSWNT